MTRLLGFALVGALFVAGTPALPQSKGDGRSFPTHPPDSRNWSFDGQRFLVAGGSSGPPSLWDLNAGKIIQTFNGHTEPAWAVAFSPDGTEVATYAAAIALNFKPSTDNSIRLWNIASGKQVQRIDIPGYEGGISIQFSPEGKRLLTVDRLNIRVWDIVTGRQLFELSSGVNPRGHAASFSPDLRTILIKEQGTLRLVEYASGKERCKMGTSGAYWDAEFNSDGSQIVAVSHQTIEVRDTTTCQQVYEFPAPATSFTRASFSADGQNIVANVGSPASAQLWDAQSGRIIRTFVPRGAQNVHDVSLSPDGKRLLTRSSFYHGTDMFFTSLWDVESGQELHRFDEGFLRFFVVGFSPDGKTVLFTDGLKPTSLWDAGSGELIREYAK
jgi:WD40 repeat protein